MTEEELERAIAAEFDEEEAKPLFRIIKTGTECEARLRKRIGRTAGRFGWYLLAVQIIVYVLALGLGFSPYLGAPAFLGEVGLIILLLLHPFVALAAPLVTLWRFRRSVIEAIRNPAAVTLWNARITTAVDAQMLPIIMRRPLDEIEFVLLEVKAEKKNFERRMSLLAGPLEKLGFLPSLLATGVALQNLPDDGVGSLWIRILAYSLFLLYIFGLYLHFYMMRLDRLLKLLDLAVVRKKATLTSSSNGSHSAAAEEQPSAGTAHAGYVPSASDRPKRP